MFTANGFDVHDSEMDTVLKFFLWKKNLTARNHKFFYIYGGAILVFKGFFFQHLNQNICPPVNFAWIALEKCQHLDIGSMDFGSSTGFRNVIRFYFDLQKTKL
jgi:hypothetical protein